MWLVVLRRKLELIQTFKRHIHSSAILKSWYSLVWIQIGKRRTQPGFAVNSQSKFNEEVQMYLKPYKAGHYLTDSLNAIFFASPLMAKIVSGADVTYPSVKDFPYLLNIVAFNCLTMEYMVCARASMDRVNVNAYKLAFSEIFKAVKNHYPKFNEKERICAILIDYSDAQMQGNISFYNYTV